MYLVKKIFIKCLETPRNEKKKNQLKKIIGEYFSKPHLIILENQLCYKANYKCVQIQ